MISFWWLFLAGFIGYILCALLSGNATEEAFEDGKQEAMKDVEFLQERNKDLARQLECVKVIGGVR
jgi:hypothetical protein